MLRKRAVMIGFFLAVAASSQAVAGNEIRNELDHSPICVGLHRETRPAKKYWGNGHVQEFGHPKSGVCYVMTTKDSCGWWARVQLPHAHLSPWWGPSTNEEFAKNFAEGLLGAKCF
jgi:hypothetical protein